MKFQDFFAGLTGGTGYSLLCSEFLTFNRNFYDDLFSISMLFLAAFSSTLLAAIGREARRRFRLWRSQKNRYSKPKHRPFR